MFLVIFLDQKMEMSSSKMQNLANGFPESEEIWQPCLGVEMQSRQLASVRQSFNKFGGFQTLSRLQITNVVFLHKVFTLLSLQRFRAHGKYRRRAGHLRYFLDFKNRKYLFL